MAALGEERLGENEQEGTPSQRVETCPTGVALEKQRQRQQDHHRLQCNRERNKQAGTRAATATSKRKTEQSEG